jgi:hypothetical protein
MLIVIFQPGSDRPGIARLAFVRDVHAALHDPSRHEGMAGCNDYGSLQKFLNGIVLMLILSVVVRRLRWE